MHNTLHAWFRSVAAVSLLALGACGGGGDDPAPAPAPPANTSPWTTQVTMGNFTVNSGNVVTNEDGKSVNHLEDYVNQSALPTANLEYFTLNAYLPTTDEHSINVVVSNVNMRNTSNQSTGNIYYQAGSAALSNVTIGGQRYAVFRLAAVYNGSGTPGVITRNNFANINFNFQATYSRNGTQVGTRNVIMSVYKR